MNNEEQQKIIWAYMVLEGLPTNGDWSTYGGWEPLNPKARYEWATQLKEREQMRFHIKAVGVDWGKTGMPDYVPRSQFAGSFSPADECDTLLGTLFLLDGKSYLIGVTNADGLYINLLQNIDEMDAALTRVKEVF